MDMEKETSDVEVKQVQKEFARKRMIQWAIYGAVIIVILVVAFSRSSETSTNSSLSWVMLVLAIAAMIYSLVNWRCPACKKYLGRGMNPRECPNCKAKLR